MTIDLEYLRWLADQGEEISRRVLPLVAAVLDVEVEKLETFLDYIRSATDVVLNAIEVFINFPSVFGAEGEGLTDANGNCQPDCPADCEDHKEVIYALRSQAVKS